MQDVTWKTEEFGSSFNGNSYLGQASQVALVVKNLPAMQDTPAQFFDWEDPLGRVCYPLQYSWASLVAQMVKNLPAMQETWVGSLTWEDPLEKEMATHSSTLA